MNVKIKQTCTGLSEKYTFNVSFCDFFVLLQSDENFRNKIINTFNVSNFEFVYWQFPVWSFETSLNQAYFYFKKSDEFLPVNKNSFSDKFKNMSPGTIVCFNNNSGDTVLISVTPSRTKEDNYLSDIMTFMKYANNKSKHALLQFIGKTMLKHNNVYLSTHGHGVPYLHVRICKTPKYYV